LDGLYVAVLDEPANGSGSNLTRDGAVVDDDLHVALVVLDA